MMAAPSVSKPSRQLDFPVHSPDGRFIACQVSKLRGFESAYVPAVLDAHSGKFIGAGEEWGLREAPTWLNDQQFSVGVAGYSLTPQPQRGKLTRLSYPVLSSVVSQPASLNRPGVTNVVRKDVLRDADIALWHLQASSAGGSMAASSIQTGQEIPLPKTISSIRDPGYGQFAAPPFKKGAPRILAALVPVVDSFGPQRLEVWNLSQPKLLFSKEYQDTNGAELHWTKDGKYILVSGIETVSPSTTDNAKADEENDIIEVIDPHTRATRASNHLALPRFSGPGIGTIEISNDGRYFLTRQKVGTGRSKKYRLVVCAIPSEKVLCTFERDREFINLPRFSTHDSQLLVWSAKDTIFLQQWKPSKLPQKLSPRQLKLKINASVFG